MCKNVLYVGMFCESMYNYVGMIQRNVMMEANSLIKLLWWMGVSHNVRYHMCLKRLCAKFQKVAVF